MVSGGKGRLERLVLEDSLSGHTKAVSAAASEISGAVTAKAGPPPPGDSDPPPPPPSDGNTALQATDDSFDKGKGKKTLTVNAPAVLANDSDPDGDVLTARLVSGPKKGELTLNPNGLFSYKGKIGKKKPVSFVYEVSDGKGNTDTATVTIRKASKK